MLRTPPLRRVATAAASVAVLLSAIGAAPARAATVIVKPIMFPVIGPVTYTDTFGAPRSGHTHAGQDLMGAKMLPLIAAVSGTVTRVTFNNAVGNSVVVTGADGWTYHYIHVNNDTPGTDNGQATREQAFPADIVLGAPVTRGQVVAFLGDSGNAESTAPHLHFEIRMPPLPGTYTGEPINAYESLRQAIVFTSTSRWELRRTPTAGPVEEQFSYGMVTGDKGLLCDWDGDGTDEAVVYRGGTWHLRNGTSSGTTSHQIAFGAVSDTPLCADVDGDGVDEPVLFKAGGYWAVRTGFALDDSLAWTVRYGLLSGDRPVLGDWDGDGRADIAIHRSGRWHIRSSARPAGTTLYDFPYGSVPGDTPVAGDWDGDGDDDAGIFRGNEWHLRSSAEVAGTTTSTFVFGGHGTQPLVAHGSTTGTPGVAVFRPKS